MINITSWLLAALALVGFGSFVVLFQERFIYFPVRYSTAELEEARTLGVQEIRFRTSQGSQVAFFCPTSETIPQRLWLVFGGNADVALGWLGLVRSVSGSRTAFLLIDYPGYGTCEGQPNPSAPVRQYSCAEIHSRAAGSSGDRHPSRPGGQYRPSQDGTSPGGIGSKPHQVCRGAGSGPQ